MTREPGWFPLPLSFLVNCVLVQALSYALRPAISYSVLDLHVGNLWLGVAAAAFALPPLLTALLAGKLNDRLGERTSLLAGSATCVLATVVALAFGGSLTGLLVASVLLGLGLLFVIIGQQAWVMRAAGPGRLDSSFGLYTLATSSGQLLGPLALLLPGPVPLPGRLQLPGGAAGTSVHVVGVPALVAALICVICAALVPAGVRRGSGPVEEVSGVRELVRRRGVLPALVTSGLVLASLDVTVAYLPLLAHERDLSPAWTAGLLMVRGAATMLSRLGLSRLTAAVGRRRVLVAGCAVAAVSLALLAIPVPAPALLALVLVYGLAAGTVQPLTMSWMTLITPAHQRGVNASLRLVGNRVGQTLVPLAVGAVSTTGGSTVAFAATGSSLLCSAWCSRSAPDDDEHTST